MCGREQVEGELPQPGGLAGIERVGGDAAPDAGDERLRLLAVLEVPAGNALDPEKAARLWQLSLDLLAA